MATVSVSLLGPFEVTLDGRPVDVPRGHQRALLASLALNAPDGAALETLVRQIWGSQPPRHPRNAVQGHVRRLRDLLGDRIRTHGDGYRLDVQPADVDALRFGRLITSAVSARSPRSRDLLSEALGLWRGDPLTGVDSDSLVREYGPALTERRLLAVERRADENLAHGHPTRDLDELREIAEANPLREPLWARLIAGLVESRQTAEALACYERIRQHLVDALGTEPGADLQRLHRRILAADGTGGLAASLHSSARPTLEAPHQLPPAPVGFTGRDRELAAMNELLAGRTAAPAAAQTVCAIHGDAGAGKTALAIHWARRVADEFPDGQLYLDLHGCGPRAPIEPASALATILQAVGVPPDQMPAGLASLTALLRTRLAGRRMLLLLDNARDADQIRPLLPGAHSMVVVTSRSQLGGLRTRDGARLIGIGELDDRDARKLLSHSIAPARIAAEPSAVQRIVELCGGLPLALRIVSDHAASQPGVPLDQLADDIACAQERLPGQGDDPAADLRAVFSWSYDRLEPETASTFRLLGLYPGTEVTAVGMAALAGRPFRDARRELDRLVSVHLLEPYSPGRFRLHDLLREYAAELAATDDSRLTSAAVRRIVDWCLGSVARARDVIGEQTANDPDLDLADAGVVPLTFSTPDEVIEWFDADRQMLVAAVRTATDHGHYREGHQLAHILRTFFHRRLRYEEFVEVAELGVECARHLGDDDALTRGLRTLGVAYTWAARTEEATKPLREAVEHAERLGDVARLAGAADALAINCARTGDFPTAISYHQQAVDASRRSGDARILADTLMNLGFTQIESGAGEAGIATTQEALEIFEQAGADLSAAYAHGNLADAHERADRADLAIDHARQSLATLRRLGNLEAAAEVLVTLGRALRSRGEQREAEAAWQEAASLIDAGHWLGPTITELLGGRVVAGSG